MDEGDPEVDEAALARGLGRVLVAAGQVTAVSSTSSAAQAHAAFLRVVGRERRTRQCFSAVELDGRIGEGGEEVGKATFAHGLGVGNKDPPRARQAHEQAVLRLLPRLFPRFVHLVARRAKHCLMRLYHRLLLAEETPHELVLCSMCNSLP